MRGEVIIPFPLCSASREKLWRILIINYGILIIIKHFLKLERPFESFSNVQMMPDLEKVAKKGTFLLCKLLVSECTTKSLLDMGGKNIKARLKGATQRYSLKRRFWKVFRIAKAIMSEFPFSNVADLQQVGLPWNSFSQEIFLTSEESGQE